MKHHPDKNSDPESKNKFQKIKESYETLMKYHGYMDEDIYNDEEYNENLYYSSYSNTIYTFLKPFIDNDIFYDIQSKILLKIIENIKSKCEDKAINMLDSLNSIKCKKIYDLLNNQKEVLNIPSSFIDKLEELYKNKIGKDKVIRIYPTIDDILIDNLYKLNENNKEYLIPLWHNELVYDNDGAELYVQCIPKLEKNVQIDDYNNIHISKQYDLIDLWKQENIVIHIGNKRLTISKDSLKLIPKQTISLPNIGISKINSTNIYDNTKRGSIIIHFHII